MKELIRSLEKHKPLLLILIFFTLLYSLISLVNHYYFRTAALDLGAYTNALYDYIHFQFNDSTVFKLSKENLLADHFDLYLVFFSPFSLLFKSYTLLILQVAFLIAGGIGVYKYFTISSKNPNTPFYAALYFYLFYGVYAALSFDYHSNVIAATLIPWFFYFFKAKKMLPSILVFVFLLISKENISLWVGFIGIGLMFNYRKEKKQVRHLMVFSLLSFAYFYIITAIVMPALSNEGSYPHFHYSVLGENYQEAIIFIITHPLETVKLLFVNHTQLAELDYLKLELFIILLVSGMYILFWKPQYLFMLIPIFFQKLYHDLYVMWGIDKQYSIEFAPIFAIGIFSVIDDISNKKLRNILTILAIVGALVSTQRIMDLTQVYTNKSKIRFYQSSHYQRIYPVGEVHKQLASIPANAIVSAQSSFLPHLAWRDNIYQFPMVKDAEYIIYSHKDLTFPLGKDKFDLIVNEIRNSNEWEVWFETNYLTILKKKILDTGY